MGGRLSKVTKARLPRRDWRPPKRKKGQHAFALPHENGAGRRPRASQGAPSAGLGTWISDFSAPRPVTNKRPLAGHQATVSVTAAQAGKALKVSGVGLTHHLTVLKKGALRPLIMSVRRSEEPFSKHE